MIVHTRPTGVLATILRWQYHHDESLITIGRYTSIKSAALPFYFELSFYRGLGRATVRFYDRDEPGTLHGKCRQISQQSWRIYTHVYVYVYVYKQINIHIHLYISILCIILYQWHVRSSKQFDTSISSRFLAHFTHVIFIYMYMYLCILHQYICTYVCMYTFIR